MAQPALGTTVFAALGGGNYCPAIVTTNIGSGAYTFNGAGNYYDITAIAFVPDPTSANAVYTIRAQLRVYPDRPTANGTASITQEPTVASAT